MTVDDYLNPIENPSLTHMEMLGKFSDKYKEIEQILNLITNREMSLAKTKVEECSQWMYAAVVKEHHKP